MKTIRVYLLFALLAAASAAAADLSFSVGYGSAHLNGGQASGGVALLPKDVAGNVTVLRLSMDFALTEKIGVEASYLAFSELTTVHSVNPSVMTLVAPNYRFRREVKALALGPTVIWLPADKWRMKAGASLVLPDFSTVLDGGGEGVREFESRSNLGFLGSIEASYSLSSQLSVGVSARYIDFCRKMVSSTALTAQQADLFIALHF
jgi:opacity protein-like surface antigen